MELDIVIPAHNEEEVILPTLKLISTALDRVPGLTWKIIVAENGSTDSTYDVVAHAGLKNVEVFRATQIGKGAAIKEAATRSQATYFGFTDADCSPDPSAFSYALPFLQEARADLVIGSRFHPETVTDRSLLRNTSSHVFNLFARMLVGVHVNDTQCPLKVMNQKTKALLLTSTEDTWLLDLEHIALVERAQLTTKTIPVVWREARYPSRKSKLRLFRDGQRALRDMVKLRKRLAKQTTHGTKSF